MPTVFIAGSISISHLHEKVKARIENVVTSNLNVVVGDANGADTSIQNCLLHSGAQKVTVYCSGDEPRNNVADWPVTNVYPTAAKGSRAYFTAKDVKMANDSDYGLMIWDCKSTGTLSNVIELLKHDKKTVVFINKEKKFVTVSDVKGFEEILSYMSQSAREKAESKIGISSKILEIINKQYDMLM